MPSFKKNLITDCLVDDHSDDVQDCGQVDQVAVTCGSFESRVNDMLDKRIDLSNDPSLRVHADGCLSCRQTLQQYEQLALVLGSARTDGGVELRRDADQQPSKLWKLPTLAAPMAIASLLAAFVITGQFFNGATDLDSVPRVAVATANLTSSPAVAAASVDVSPAIEQAIWEEQDSVLHLQGLVNSGSEWLAAGRQQAAVIQGLSEVRLDLDQLEDRLAALQPVLNYSGRIPALSPVQGTVCFTLGWLKKGKESDQPELDSVPDKAAELGMHLLGLRDLA